MSLTIEQIEQQIADLQKVLYDLKNPKLKVTREFTGQYFEPYDGKQYRRMESAGIPIWETYLETKSEWVTLSEKEIAQLEQIYIKDCVSEA